MHLTRNKVCLLLLISALSFFVYFPSYAKVLYSINFSQPSTQDARKWLTSQKYNFEADAKYPSELGLLFKNKALVLDAKTQLFALIINRSLHLNNAKTIKIEWGVNKFPVGANYEKHINNEAIMVYVYFGDKKLSSDSIFIPNSPYFIGLFIGKEEKLNTPFIGRHFTQGGRFICLANPKLGETITSEYNLEKGFKESFGKKLDVPFISGIALEVETSSTTPSKAFIKKIEICD
ncbi:MAG TPA: hypothetical protein QF753_04080 [Victivallales bacterium]|nr:hypothetical protein [Victivallales bacterium]